MILVQLGILLYLTGGIFNPFCVLVIAPVIISASYLPVFWTIILSFFSIILIFFINLIYIPIEWQGIFLTPNIYKQGLVFALIITIIFIAVYVYLFASSSRKISTALSETKFLLSNQKKITEVGSLSAAAVHELSTPLNTIFLILNDFQKNKKLIKDSDILKGYRAFKISGRKMQSNSFKTFKKSSKSEGHFFKKNKN